MSAIGRFYKITDAARSWTVQGELAYLKPAADKICKLEYVVVAASGGTADAGDAQEELFDVEIIRLNATVTVGSGGAAFTPIKQLINDAAAGAAARVADTTKATATTTEVLHADGMNNRSPFLWYPKDDQEEWIANAGAVVVRLNTTPADAILLSTTVGFRELP
jgi:hypothetical protein